MWDPLWDIKVSQEVVGLVLRGRECGVLGRQSRILVARVQVHGEPSLMAVDGLPISDWLPVMGAWSASQILQEQWTGFPTCWEQRWQKPPR